MTLEQEIAIGESATLEFKRALTKDDTRWLRTVVAFANGRGGRILFGVDDDRSVVGVGEDVFGVRDAICNAVAHSCEPMVPMTISVATISGRSVLVLDVRQGMECPYFLKGKGDKEGVFIRYDATTRQADEPILRELRIDGAGKSFDKLPCRGLKITEKDIARLCRNLKRSARANAATDAEKRRIKDVTPRQLVKWGVLIDRGGELVPSNAFALLTGNPILTPVTKCGVFKGRDRAVFVDRRQFDGPVHEQLEAAYDYALAKINMGARFVGVHRQDVYEIPPDAIREIITNAILHRNYINADASPVTVALYDDRLEVTSPGGLPRNMTLEKMMTGYSECRNKALAEAFSYMNLIENWGSGVLRYTKQIQDAGLSAPRFDVWPNSVRVEIMRGQPKELEERAKRSIPQVAPQATPQVKHLLEVLEGEMDRSELMRALHLRDRKTFRMDYLKPALEAGLVEMTQPNAIRSPTQKYRKKAVPSE